MNITKTDKSIVEKLGITENSIMFLEQETSPANIIKTVIENYNSVRIMAKEKNKVLYLDTNKEHYKDNIVNILLDVGNLIYDLSTQKITISKGKFFVSEDKNKETVQRELDKRLEDLEET